MFRVRGFVPSRCMSGQRRITRGGVGAERQIERKRGRERLGERRRKRGGRKTEQGIKRKKAIERAREGG